MIKRFTYREVTVFIGVIVALIVVFTLWIHQPIDGSTSRIPAVSNLKKIKDVTVKDYVNAFEVLRSGGNSPY